MSIYIIPGPASAAANEPAFNDDDVLYDIRINGKQRRVLHAALQTFMSAQPGEEAERDDFGTPVSASLEDMLDPDGTTGPLTPVPALNSFVL